MKKPILSILFLPLLLLTTASVNLSTAEAKNTGHLPSVQINDKFIIVDDLGAEFHSASGTITVKAKIQNVSRSTLRGYATIYLLSPSGQPLYSYQEEVNSGEGFDHGSTIHFKASTQIPDINKVGAISVDFTRK